jgi:CHAT domain-containing protein
VVLVSLWIVDASSTLDLMVDFYNQLKGRNNDATVRYATTKDTIERIKPQKNIMRRKDYSHTYYWAPFVLVREPKARYFTYSLVPCQQSSLG